MKRCLISFLVVLCSLLPIGYAEGVYTAQQAEFVLPMSVIRIENGAFAGIGAESVYLPDGLKEIESNAFADCENLLVIRIPASVESIAEYAFPGCTSSLCIYGIPQSAAYNFAIKKGYHFFHELTGKEENNTLPVFPIGW